MSNDPDTCALGKEEPAVIREYLSDFDEESATITEFIVYLDSDVFDDFIPPGMMSDDDIPF